MLYLDWQYLFQIFSCFFFMLLARPIYQDFCVPFALLALRYTVPVGDMGTRCRVGLPGSADFLEKREIISRKSLTRQNMNDTIMSEHEGRR